MSKLMEWPAEVFNMRLRPVDQELLAFLHESLGQMPATEIVRMLLREKAEARGFTQNWKPAKVIAQAKADAKTRTTATAEARAKKRAAKKRAAKR